MWILLSNKYDPDVWRRHDANMMAYVIFQFIDDELKSSLLSVAPAAIDRVYAGWLYAVVEPDNSLRPRKNMSIIHFPRDRIYSIE